jgi:hypothetical protein
MGVVHLARQLDLDRLVALKELSVPDGDRTEFAERFLRESRLAGSLNHPNIVTVHEYFEDAGTAYIAMEYVPRGSLRLWVGHLSLAQLGTVLEGLLAGLAAVEPSGMVHRDLKPENVMVTADGRVKIADFGIATATASVKDGADEGADSTMGTPAYMAPEQAMSLTLGPWTDLYSVGILAYEQLVGKVPFADSREPLAVLRRHVTETIPPVSASRPDIDASMSDWVGRLLVKDAAHRTGSALAAWEDLEEILIALLGPRWRRDSRLPTPAEVRVQAPTPAWLLSRRIEVPVLPPDLSSAETHERTLRTPRQGLVWRAPWRVEKRGAVLGSTAAGLLSAVAVFLLAGTDRGASSEALARVTMSGALTVRYPAGWREAPANSVIPIVGVADVVTLAPSLGNGALAVGTVPRVGPALLPASLEATLRPTAAAERVGLSGHEFLRYRGAFAGARKDELAYARPTMAGVMIGICRVPAGAAGKARAIEADCARILGGAVLRRAKSIAIGPSHAYAVLLSRTLETLNASRRSQGARLEGAPSAGAQGNAAAQLSLAHSRASAALRRASPGPAEAQINERLIGILGRIAAGYGTLARGARQGRAPLYESARHVVVDADAELKLELRQVRELGIRLGASRS